MERWWGFRPRTPDGGPLLGQGAIPGLWLATGHHRNGVLLAAITAEILARSLHDPNLALAPDQEAEAEKVCPEGRWLELFAPDRFARSRGTGLD